MNETWNLILPLMAGVLLGAIFFGGLWWTIRKSLLSRQPALWFFGSLLLRTSIAIAGFYFVAHGSWERMLICLLGFLLARLLVTWWLHSANEVGTLSSEEARHAP